MKHKRTEAGELDGFDQIKYGIALRQPSVLLMSKRKIKFAA